MSVIYFNFVVISLSQDLSIIKLQNMCVYSYHFRPFRPNGDSTLMCDVVVVVVSRRPAGSCCFHGSCRQVSMSSHS